MAYMTFGDDFDPWRNKTPEELLETGLKFRTGKDGVKKNSAVALIFIQTAATRGNLPAAHMALGEMHLNGEGTEPNGQEAALSYNRAINAGAPEGHLALGDMYLRGRGVPQSDRTARRFIMSAVLAELPEGYFRLGMMYDAGIDVPQSMPKAIEFLTKAADHDHPTAIAKLVDLQSELSKDDGRLAQGEGPVLARQIEIYMAGRQSKHSTPAPTALLT